VRLRAANASGVVYGRQEAFTTFEAGTLPVVSKVSPSKPASGGGTSMTVKGQFLSGAIAVTFGETETTDITADSASALTVVAPPGVGTVDVVVTTAAGQSPISSADRVTYGGPAVTGISAGSGPVAGGTEVTVTGTGFEPGGGATTFLFGKALATSVECASISACTMIVPPARRGKAATVKVVASVNGKKSKASPVRFTYVN
jgi:hypothetical protein